MDLTNTFTVATPIDEMWPILCDIERIAPCMPGARLTEVDGDDYQGLVKVKVGPITATFKGTATMVERDDDAHRAVLRASGKDTGGKGNASATITASATATADGGTEVTISTDLSITGKVAQFGRSAMSDISTRLLGQFVECLESRVLSAPAEGTGAADAVVDVTDDAAGPDAAGALSAPAAEAPTPEPEAEPSRPADGPADRPSDPPAARPTSAEPEPIDLLDAAGAPIARAAGPIAGGVALVVLLYWWRRRRSA